MQAAGDAGTSELLPVKVGAQGIGKGCVSVQRIGKMDAKAQVFQQKSLFAAVKDLSFREQRRNAVVERLPLVGFDIHLLMHGPDRAGALLAEGARPDLRRGRSGASAEIPAQIEGSPDVLLVGAQGHQTARHPVRKAVQPCFRGRAEDVTLLHPDVVPAFHQFRQVHLQFLAGKIAFDVDHVDLQADPAHLSAPDGGFQKLHARLAAAGKEQADLILPPRGKACVERMLGQAAVHRLPRLIHDQHADVPFILAVDEGLRLRRLRVAVDLRVPFLPAKRQKAAFRILQTVQKVDGIAQVLIIRIGDLEVGGQPLCAAFLCKVLHVPVHKDRAHLAGALEQFGILLRLLPASAEDQHCFLSCLFRHFAHVPGGHEGPLGEAGKIVQVMAAPPVPADRMASEHARYVLQDKAQGKQRGPDVEKRSHHFVGIKEPGGGLRALFDQFLQRPRHVRHGRIHHKHADRVGYAL